MQLSLDGRVAIVTGGSRGIGRAIAQQFAEAGAQVLITARKEADLQEAAAAIGPRCEWMVAHNADAEGAAAAAGQCVDRHGGLDILVNNAATNPHYGPMSTIDASRAAKTFEVNQWGPLLWTECALDAGMRERGGNVINIASVGGLTTEAGIGFYNVTKAAIIHMTRQLAAELGPKVRVNAIAAGIIKTEFSRKLWEGKEEKVAARLPLRRLGTPEDVGQAALFLASDAASYITGHCLAVEGGALVQTSVTHD